MCFKITGQPFRSFATGFFYAACRWEHGTTASSAGHLVNTVYESPSHHFIIQDTVLSHENVVASEASNSRLVYLKTVYDQAHHYSAKSKLRLSFCSVKNPPLAVVNMSSRPQVNALKDARNILLNCDFLRPFSMLIYNVQVL